MGDREMAIGVGDSARPVAIPVLKRCHDGDTGKRLSARVGQGAADASADGQGHVDAGGAVRTKDDGRRVLPIADVAGTRVVAARVVLDRVLELEGVFARHQSLRPICAVGRGGGAGAGAAPTRITPHPNGDPGQRVAFSGPDGAAD